MATTSPLLASNSDRTTPQTHPRDSSQGIGIGIDKLALSLPIMRIVQDKLLWDNVNTHWAQAHDYLNINTSLHVTARQVGLGLRCTVEYNPSRVIDPYGWSLCTTEEVFPTVGTIMNQLRGRVDLEGELDDILVTRLDVARDFKVSDPQFFLTGLRPLHRRNGANPSLWFDEKSGAASSLRVGTSWSPNPRRPNYVTLYDKYLKARTPESRGVLRWEMSARKWTRRYGDIKTLADLTPERVRRFALDRWSWSRMGEVVVGEDEFVDRVYAAEWLTQVKKDRFLGQYLGLRQGKRVLQGTAREEFNGIQRRLGVTLSGDTRTCRRLDFLTGGEIVGPSEAS
jgi:hypothetical protein